jgi:hypothetical protein
LLQRFLLELWPNKFHCPKGACVVGAKAFCLWQNESLAPKGVLLRTRSKCRFLLRLENHKTPMKEKDLIHQCVYTAGYQPLSASKICTAFVGFHSMLWKDVNASMTMARLLCGQHVPFSVEITNAEDPLFYDKCQKLPKS